METIYCISGLGADKRIFGKVNIPGAHLQHLDWPPYDKHDELACYAQKLADKIPDQHPNILGVSFGGMLAVEIAKIRPVRKVVIVSSAKKHEELPPMKRFVRVLLRSRLLPSFLFNKPNKLVYKRFGTETEEEEQLLGNILRDTDRHFAKWAVKAMMTWRNEVVPEGIYHIHGNADQVILPNGIKANYWVSDGGHFMIYNRASLINPILTREFIS